jgi:PAS domain S-box-containing protein
MRVVSLTTRRRAADRNPSRSIDAFHLHHLAKSRDVHHPQALLVGDTGTAMRVGSSQIGPDQLLRMLDAANEVIALFDRELRHCFVSESIERVTGRPRRDFIGKTNRELGMAPELCAHWDEALKRVLDEGEIIHDTFDFPGAGGLCHFEVTLEPEFDESRAVVGFISAAFDMTRHIATERALAKRDEQLCHALSAANAGAWEWEFGGLELSLWPECHALYGLTDTASASLAQWRQNVHPDDVAAVSSAFATMAAGGQDRYRCEFRVVHPQRGTRWLVELGRLLRTPAGNAVCMTGITLDVTHRKQAEQERRAAETSKGEFIATLAHEMRNALAPIVNAARLFESDVSEENKRKAQQIVGRQADHMNELLRDLSDLSAIKLGRLPLMRRRVDLRAAVDKGLEQAQPGLAERGHHLVVELPEQTVSVEGDERRLVQVISNLLLNAVKFTPPGGHLHVRVFSDQGGNADDGIGIDDSPQSRIFDMFAQVAPSSGAGFGIGLALVQRIVEMHGGRVSVRSDGLGKGTPFTISLPSSASADRSPARQFGHPL